MSLLFNMMSRFVIDFLPMSKRLISWVQSPSTVTVEPKKIKSVTASTFPPSVCHEVMGTDAMILVFWMLSFNPCCFHLYPRNHYTLVHRDNHCLLFRAPHGIPLCGCSSCTTRPLLIAIWVVSNLLLLQTVQQWIPLCICCLLVEVYLQCRPLTLELLDKSRSVFSSKSLLWGCTILKLLPAMYEVPVSLQ